MHWITRRTVQWAAAMALTTVTAIPAVAQRAPTLHLSDGRTIEVLGLRRWTIGMIEDSLRRYAPGDSLQSSACAAILRYKLHFADASVGVIAMGNGMPDQIVIILREPQDSARVHYRPMALDTNHPRSDWSLVTRQISQHPGLFGAGTVSIVLNRAGARPIRFRSAADSLEAAAVASFVLARTTDHDRREALDALAHSSNMLDRSVATLILANFGSRDDTWSALVDALRESDGPVKVYAARVLSALAARSVRVIDWHHDRPAIHAILDGTSVSIVVSFASTLLQTGIGPSDAGPFLHRGGSVLVDLMMSDEPLFSQPARDLLIRLRGLDLGSDPAKWQAWIASL
jgi:hypothetical protein